VDSAGLVIRDGPAKAFEMFLTMKLRDLQKSENLTVDVCRKKRCVEMEWISLSVSESLPGSTQGSATTIVW
jgi:hypothetical protein